MEDSHTVSLNLDGPREDADTNTFFAVYDGHGGTELFFWLSARALSESNTGGSVARFAGQNVHRRLLNEDSYQQQNYEEAMRRAFLGTDEDILAGA
jgi:protein phosphatase PTC2/3